MSVLVITKVHGDTGTFRESLTSRADEYEKFGERAKAAGGLHHRFGVGDGFVVVLDEWETVEAFQQFMANPDLQAFIGSVGGQSEPEVTVAEAVTSADQY